MQPKVQNLHHVVHIQHHTVTRDVFGAEVRTWATVATIRASIDPLSGREYFQAAQAQAETTHKLTIRWYEGLTTKHRILFGTRILEIQSVLVPEEKRQWMVLMCKEQI